MLYTKYIVVTVSHILRYYLHRYTFIDEWRRRECRSRSPLPPHLYIGSCTLLAPHCQTMCIRIWHIFSFQRFSDSDSWFCDSGPENRFAENSRLRPDIYPPNSSVSAGTTSNRSSTIRVHLFPARVSSLAPLAPGTLTAKTWVKKGARSARGRFIRRTLRSAPAPRRTGRPQYRSRRCRRWARSDRC
jgi:hypothetical protein